MSIESPPPSYAVLATPAVGSPWPALAVRLAAVQTLDEGLAAIAEVLVAHGDVDVAHWFVGGAAGVRSHLWCARDESETLALLRRLRSEYAVRNAPSRAVIEDGRASDDGTMRLAATLGVPFRLLLPMSDVVPPLAFELWSRVRLPLEELFDDAATIAAIAKNVAQRAERTRTLNAEATRFRRVIAEAPVPLLVLAEDSGVVDANRVATETFGVVAGDAFALPLVPEGDSSASSVVLRGELGVERDGIERRIEIVAWPFDDGATRLSVAIGRDVTEQVAASRELRRAIDEQARYAQVLSRRYSEIALLSQWAETLETCVHRSEVHEVMGRFAPMLFAESSGSFFQPFGKGTSFEQVASWGRAEGTMRTFSLEDCWAFRRGVVHGGGAESGGPRCPHVDANGHNATLCIPLLAQGQPLGLLHLAFSQGSPTFDQGLRYELAKTVGEHIALALANLRLREELRQQSIRDPLTGLNNRRSMEETLEREAHRARRCEGAVSVLLIDVDHFKKFNDDYGHDAGDAVLVSVSEFLRKRTRGEDLACRYGGEEFLLVLTGAPFEAALKRAEEVRAGIAALPVSIAGRTLGRITVSIGVASLPAHATEPGELVTLADAALYEAKRSGRNRVVGAHARAEG